MRESAGDPLEVGKDPVALLIMQAVEGGREEPVVIHRKKTWNRSWGWSGSGLFRAFPGSMSSRNWPWKVNKRGVGPLQVAHQNLMLIDPAKAVSGPSEPFRNPRA
jgi:hypothetical protein